MVSDTSTEEGAEKEETSAMGEEPSGAEHVESTMEAPSAPAAPAPRPKAKGGGRRAALRILRENVEGVSKNLESFRKNHEISTKRLEKQVAAIRSEVASLKSHISKESASARKKEEVALSRIFSKLSAKPAPARKGKKKKGNKKGKK
jgi:hypothetical protein